MSRNKKISNTEINDSRSKLSENTNNNTKSEDLITVVGIGGSAGAISAFEQFFVHMPANTGAAFVIAQHFAANQETILPELIARNTQMKVGLFQENEQLEPNHVYIIPPSKEVVAKNGVLNLISNTNAIPRNCIDTFFMSLANQYKEKAVGIIFSGMGTDGTEGIKSIKASKGLVLVQDPKTTTYDSMPKSAISTGMVDAVLPVEDLPEQVIHFFNNNFQSKPVENTYPRLTTESSLQKIINLIRVKTSHDFSFYKTNTILRRIERRMNIHHFSDIALYVNYLEKTPLEVETLFNELLIGVTNFFRDKEAFDFIKQKVIPQILERKTGGEIRVWIAACSSGEEAYSMAIVMVEVLEELEIRSKYKIQLFGTDIDQSSINTARLGIYPESIEDHVSAERLERFFLKKDNKYQIKKEIREMMVFAPQSLIKDPPFTKLDLLCCRNFMIYLTAELQKKLIALFHYSLNLNGILFLGSSETINGFADLFEPISTKHRIFKKLAAPNVFTGMLNFPLSYIKENVTNEKVNDKRKGTKGKAIPGKVQKVLLDSYAPPSIVITSSQEIIYINGQAGKYMELVPGQASLNVERLAREGLKVDLLSIISEVKDFQKPSTRKNIWVKLETEYSIINITARPFDEVKGMHGLILISFEEIARGEQNERSVKHKDPNDDHSRKLITELEKELKFTKAHLQSSIQEMEASLEEMTSTNEELQSTNEELTTSKEEMQSLNEELITVNSELNAKMDEFSQLNNDIKNLLKSTEIITLFLDNELNIKRFTPHAKRVFKLIPGDIGRPLTDIVSKLNYENLVKDINQVLETLAYQKADVQTLDGEWLEMKIVPYRTTDNYIAGVVLTFTDATRLKRLNKELEDMKDIADKIFETSREAIIIFDSDHRIINANYSFSRKFDIKDKNIIGKSLLDILGKKLVVKDFKDFLKRVLAENKEVEDYIIDDPKKGKLVINSKWIPKKGVFIMSIGGEDC